jgi:hypothetical protein
MTDEVCVHCECGEQHWTDRDVMQIECSCGARYAVNVTQLRPPAED